MAWDDFKRAKGWMVELVGNPNPWNLNPTPIPPLPPPPPPPPPDKLHFSGPGDGSSTSELKKNLNPLVTGCHYDHLSLGKDTVRVKHSSTWYIITRTTGPSRLTCREEGAGSGTYVWTAVEGG